MFNFIIIIIAKYFYLVSILSAAIYLLTISGNGKKQLAILAIPSLILSYLVAKLSALFIKDPRPFVVEHITPLIPHAPNNGFPSDHTLLTMTIASIIFVYNKALGIALFIIAALIGIARVLANIHHSLDIIGATIIAIGATTVILLLERKISKKSN